jgi:NagD protein
MEPTMIGKPEPTLMEQAMRRMNATPETTAAIGDRPETDILSAQRAGLLSILALSGATDRARLARFDGVLPEEHKPDLIVHDIRALVHTWARALDQ